MDKQTGMTKLIVAFRNFANVTKKLFVYPNRRASRFRMGANHLSMTALHQIWPTLCVSDNGGGGGGGDGGQVVPFHAMMTPKGE
jgi:hypothetical protein